MAPRSYLPEFATLETTMVYMRATCVCHTAESLREDPRPERNSKTIPGKKSFWCINIACFHGYLFVGKKTGVWIPNFLLCSTSLVQSAGLFCLYKLTLIHASTCSSLGSIGTNHTP